MNMTFKLLPRCPECECVLKIEARIASCPEVKCRYNFKPIPTRCVVCGDDLDAADGIKFSPMDGGWRHTTCDEDE